jgi:hypothetical protein
VLFIARIMDMDTAIRPTAMGMVIRATGTVMEPASAFGNEQFES